MYKINNNLIIRKSHVHEKLYLLYRQFPFYSNSENKLYLGEDATALLKKLSDCDNFILSDFVDRFSDKEEASKLFNVMLQYGVVCEII